MATSIPSASGTKPKKGVSLLFQSPYLLGVALFASLGGFLFGYDQGVVSGVLTMESFGAAFPRIFADSGFKGWFVSVLLLAAWFGSLINGPIADKYGRKADMMLAVAIFTVGSAIQAGAINIPMLFIGRSVAGLSVGMLTMVIPLYISEVSLPDIRGGLVVLQQLAITVGILASFWIDYGTHYIGGVRCAPDIPYTGGSSTDRTFNPYLDVGPDGCTGQSDASWRIPLALQIIPALILGFGMVFYPDSPRWLLVKERDEEAFQTLSKLRRLAVDHPEIVAEVLDIKAAIMLENSYVRDNYAGLSGFKLHAAQYMSLLANKSRFRRLAIGCSIMFFQQFMGCNAMIYYAPTMFKSLGLNGNTTSLLATGVYGIVNCLSTVPAVLLIDRLGRRPLLMCGAAGTCISLVIVGAIIGTYGDTLADHKIAGWAGVAFIYIYDVNFSYSFAPIGWVLPSEIFTIAIRSKAISITTSTTWMCNFIIGLVTPDMLEKITWGTYIFFAAFCLLAFAFTYFFVPETCGKTLEDMDLVFGDTTAHEEKQRLREIEAQLRGVQIDGNDVEKGSEERVFRHAEDV
ncbi:probable transporter (major facilitator superfamily) [Rhynchosporium agropyri]|uniref:Probable transporter (Major facilitator superfamily) n=1 Tax=Rhynchosporium agropyri TaxID=914238 RepID=A0A1E1LBW0_9HELO|nr:probable transporter (major facilitator superfamily) [Rhynchosporium agropyri]